jgi:hypothetical protein
MRKSVVTARLSRVHLRNRATLHKETKLFCPDRNDPGAISSAKNFETAAQENYPAPQSFHFCIHLHQGFACRAVMKSCGKAGGSAAPAFFVASSRKRRVPQAGKASMDTISTLWD